MGSTTRTSMNLHTWKKGDPWYKVWESPDWLYRCPNCRSKHIQYPIELEHALELKGPREVNCKRCGTSMPWLQHRDYGRTPKAFRMMEQRNRRHPPWEEKTPLWAIPKTER